jgi:hypothetical protein
MEPMPTLPATFKAEPGTHVPIPTLPFITVNAPSGVAVPMPTFILTLVLKGMYEATAGKEYAMPRKPKIIKIILWPQRELFLIVMLILVFLPIA